MTPIDRRAFVIGAGCAALAAAQPVRARRPRSLGDRLYADVVHYAGLGEHRTGGIADAASTVWLGDRLRRLGYTVETPGFELPTFDVDAVSLELQASTLSAFPAWPVVPTAATRGLLRDASVPGDLVGSIALVVLPYRPGSAFIVRGFGSAVLDAQARGAAAIVVVTEGPTGEIIALNADLTRYVWRVPVILVAGREAERLRALAAAGEQVTVRITGTPRPSATATNVVARRSAARGAPQGVLVMTTPKSGWFTCAGERGSGIAVFLAMAERLARRSRRQLLLVATSGHELEGLGGEAFLKHHAPPPSDVAMWTHIGANIASNAVDFTPDVRRLETIHPQRGILVPADLISQAEQAFAGQPGYATPVDILSDRAVGEVVLYRRDGYRRLIGLVGGHPLHHTRLDTPANVTSPAALEPVARGLWTLLSSLG